MPPGEGKPQSKDWKGKTYNWCAKHKGWVIHDPKDCQFDVKDRLKRKRDSSKGQDSPKQPKVDETKEKVNQIWKALVEDSDNKYCQFINKECDKEWKRPISIIMLVMYIMTTFTKYILAPVVTYVCSFMRQNLYYGNLAPQTLSMEDMLPMLPKYWWCV